MNRPDRQGSQARASTSARSRASLATSRDAREEAAALAHQEWLLDDSLMQTFPASDAISPGFMT